MITSRQDLKELYSIFQDDNDNPLELTEGQLDIGSAILDPDILRVVMSTPTQYGKSMTVAASACLLLFNPVQKEKILIIAPSKEQAQIIMNYVITFVLQVPALQDGLLNVKTVQRLKTQFSKDNLTWSDGRQVKILSASASSNVGDINKAGKNLMGSGGTTIIVDETALIPDIIMSKVLRMLGKSKRGKLVLISNPFGQGYFYQAAQSTRFHKIWIDYNQAIKEGRFTKDYIDEMRESMSTDDFKILYEVKFIEGGTDSYINGEDYEFGEERFKQNINNQKWVEAKNKEPLKVGVDPARGGRDATGIVIRKGFKKLYEEEYNNRKLIEIKQHLIELQKEYNFKWEEVYVDMVGLGVGLVEMLELDGYEINGVSGAESPDTVEQYYNMRAELYGRAKDDIRQGGVDVYGIDNQKLRAELSRPQYKYRNKTGFTVVLLESKEDMKKRGMKSPNIADAWCLTYYEGIDSDLYGESYSYR